MVTLGETGYPDTFEVIDGPGDGTEYPITRTPVDIGSDPECAVLVQCDPRVHQFHARVTVVSEGYRIRTYTEAPCMWTENVPGGSIPVSVVQGAWCKLATQNCFCNVPGWSCQPQPWTAAGK